MVLAAGFLVFSSLGTAINQNVIYPDLNGNMKLWNPNGNNWDTGVDIPGDGVGGIAESDGDGNKEVMIYQSGVLKTWDVQTGNEKEYSTVSDIGRPGPAGDIDSDGDVEFFYKSTGGELKYYDFGTDSVTTTSASSIDDVGCVANIGTGDKVAVYRSSSGNMNYYDIDSGSTSTLTSDSRGIGGCYDENGDGNKEIAFDDGSVSYYDYDTDTRVTPGPSSNYGNLGAFDDFDDDGNGEVAYRTGSDTLNIYEFSSTSDEYNTGLSSVLPGLASYSQLFKPPVFEVVSTSPSKWNFSDSIDVTANVTDDGSVSSVNADVWKNGTQIVSSASLSKQASGNWTVDNLFTVDEANVYYNISLTATDDAGATTTYTTSQLIEEQASEPTILAPENQTYYKYNNTHKYKIQDDGDDVENETYTCKIYIDGSYISGTEVDLQENASLEDRTFSKDIATDIGTHKFLVSCTDELGNVTNSSRYYTVDNFNFTNILSTDPTFETLYENYTLDAVAGSMVENYTTKLYWNSSLKDQKTIQTESNIEYDYQEDANATGTGETLKNSSNLFDGDYDTYAQAGPNLIPEEEDYIGYGYMNYSKPGAPKRNLSYWTVKDGAGKVNLSIPENCWDQNPLQFRATSDLRNVEPYHSWSCWNGSSWKVLRSGNDGEGKLFEEAMYWSSGVAEIVSKNSFGVPLVENNNTVEDWYIEVNVSYREIDTGNTVYDTKTSSNESQTVQHNYYINQSYIQDNSLLENSEYTHITQLKTETNQNADINPENTYLRTSSTTPLTLQNSTTLSQTYSATQNTGTSNTNKENFTSKNTFNLSFKNSSRTINTEKDFTLYEILLTDCNQGLDSNETLKFNSFKEENISETLLTDLSASFLIEKNNLDKSFNFSSTNKTTHTFCIYPSWAEYTISTSSEKQIRYDEASGVGTDYTERSYFIVNQTISNSTTEIPLYLLDKNKASEIIFKVLDSNTEPYPGLVGRVERYYPSQDKSLTVESFRTGTEGKGTGTLNIGSDVYYVVKLFEDKDFIYETEQQQVSESPWVIQLGVESYTGYVDYLDAISYKCSKNISSLNCSYTSSRDDLNNFTLEVDRQETIGFENVCTVSSQTITGFVECTGLNLTNESYNYEVTATFGETDYLLETGNIGNLPSPFGEAGLVASMFIIAGALLIGIWSPFAAITLGMIATGVTYLINFLEITQAAFVSIILIGFVMLWRMMK